MVPRIFAIAFIFFCTSVAWGILGGTVMNRTYSTNNKLQGRVESIWGKPHVQRPPGATYDVVSAKKVASVEDGKQTERMVEYTEKVLLPCEGTDLDVKLDLEHRQKGLLWYSTYKVGLAGVWTFRNDTAQERNVTFSFDFPTEQAVYDDLQFTIDGAAVPVTYAGQLVQSAPMRLGPGQTARLAVSYRSQGLDSWRYELGSMQVKNFALKASTNFKDVDFPENTLSPTTKSPAGKGWDLAWNYRNMISGFQIGVQMPEKLQPVPLAGRISFFAPVSLFFFFFLMFIITTLREIELHPMNYFFLAAAFFSFHLLLAYLVDHISIHAAFLICSVVSVLLVTTYLRLVVGGRFALVEAGLAQLVYLVLFSYAFFLKGYTGLAITICSILTLFVVMQMTGRTRWAETFSPQRASATPNPAGAR